MARTMRMMPTFVAASLGRGGYATNAGRRVGNARGPFGRGGSSSPGRTRRQQAVGQVADLLALHQPAEPARRNAAHAVMGAGDLAADRRGGIGIVAEIGRA